LYAISPISQISYDDDDDDDDGGGGGGGGDYNEDSYTKPSYSVPSVVLGQVMEN
jgi:hypothetical protein